MSGTWRRYENGDWTVAIDEECGSKVRMSEAAAPRAAFPECVDMTITRRCSEGCPWCYLGCTRDGAEARLSGWRFLETLRPWTELAINGNDLDHPGLDAFLDKMASRHVLVNVTVSARQLEGNLGRVLALKGEGLVHGVGVSMGADPARDAALAARVPNSVCHVIAGLVTPRDLEAMAAAGARRVLVLGYKELGRGADFATRDHDAIASRIRLLGRELPRLSAGFATVSLDNLAISQLRARRMMGDAAWAALYQGPDGTQSMAVDLVDGTYATSSTSPESHPIGDLSIDEMFARVRTD